MIPSCSWWPAFDYPTAFFFFFITGQFELKSKPKPGSLSRPRYINHVTQSTKLRLLTIGSNTELSFFYRLCVCWLDCVCALICAFVCLPLLSAELANLFQPNNKWVRSRANYIHRSPKVSVVVQSKTGDIPQVRGVALWNNTSPLTVIAKCSSSVCYDMWITEKS